MHKSNERSIPRRFVLRTSDLTSLFIAYNPIVFESDPEPIEWSGKKDEKSEVSYTEFLAGVINLRCKTPEDRDFDQPKIAAPAVGRSGCGRNKTDFYGLHGHSFVLTSMDWLGGLRCCVAQGEKKSL